MSNEEMKEKEFVYFIEDLDTNEWYCVDFRMRHSHDGKKDLPQWTKDPLKAFAFRSRKDANEILIKGLEMRIGGLNGEFLVINYVCFIKKHDAKILRDIPKNLAVTEHEFVNPHFILQTPNQ